MPFLHRYGHPGIFTNTGIQKVQKGQESWQGILREEGQKSSKVGLEKYRGLFQMVRQVNADHIPCSVFLVLIHILDFLVSLQ